MTSAALLMKSSTPYDAQRMPQTVEQRRLIRLAARMNTRAASAGSVGRMSAEDLAVIERGSDHCHYCNIGLEWGHGTFDHAIPLDRRGPNLSENVVRSCYTCGRTKFTKTPEEMAEFATVTMTCRVCGKQYKPRHAEWKAGRATTCSRRCAAKSRFRGAIV